MVLCLPILKMALESDNPSVQKLVSESIIKHTRLKRFEQIKGLHRVVLKKHQQQISVTSYATELIKHAVIHKSLAEGLELSRKLADQKCQKALFGTRKPGHVGMLGHVGAVALESIVRDIESDFVQPRRPVQHLLGQV